VDGASCAGAGAGTGENDGGACAGNDSFETDKSDAFDGAAVNVPVDKGSLAVSCGPALTEAATTAGAVTGVGAGAGAGADGTGGGRGELGTVEEEPRRGGGGFVNDTIPTAGRATAGVSDAISDA